MTSDERVSVIVPTYGRHDRLSAALLSAARQLTSSDEILVIDDGSEPPIDIEGLGPIEPDVRLIRNHVNLGPASARNTGLRNAKNGLIAFLDSDDLWLDGKLAAQREIVGRHRDALVAIVCGWQDTSNDRVVRQRVPVPSSSRSDFFAGCWFCPGSTLLIRRDAFEICGQFAEGLRRLEDFEWFLRFALAGGRVQVADMIGASVARGGNARREAIEAAARLIADRLETVGATKGERANLHAYLDLERAVAHLNVSEKMHAAFYLARSLYRRPRLRLQLQDWWRLP